jgi:phospholipid transport system transporter-binding protein
LVKIQKTAKSWQLSGDITIDDASSLLKETHYLPAQTHLVIDFSEVGHVDTATLSMMFEWLRHAKTKDCDLKFSYLPQNLQSLMALYGITKLIPQVKR